MALLLQNVSKRFDNRLQRVNALSEVNLALNPGDFVVAHGPSGSGKSTLLLMLGGMLCPTSGSVIFGGTPLYTGSPVLLNRYRRNHVGFVFQRFFLLDYLSLYENIRFSLALHGKPLEQSRILKIAEELGLSNRLAHRPAELSIGERQRAAIARAIVAEPSIILADEPTGNLDAENGWIVAEYFRRYALTGKIVVMVTHFPDLFGMGNRTILVRSGVVEECTEDAVKGNDKKSV